MAARSRDLIERAGPGGEPWTGMLARAELRVNAKSAEAAVETALDAAYGMGMRGERRLDLSDLSALDELDAANVGALLSSLGADAAHFGAGGEGGAWTVEIARVRDFHGSERPTSESRHATGLRFVSARPHPPHRADASDDPLHWAAAWRALSERDQLGEATAPSERPSARKPGL